MEIRTTPYDQFWLLYLRAHSRPLTRALHYGGTLLALACLVGGAVWDWRLLPGAPVIGYGCAWAAHFGIEGNRPQSFGHPFWSLGSDLRMLGLWLTGRLGRHLRRAGIDQG